MEATIPIRSVYRKQEEWLMGRLHQIISGNGHGPFKKDSGYTWQLDSSNNWWAELRPEGLVLASRYGGERATAFFEYCRQTFI